MADRRVKVVFSAEIQNFKSAMDAAATATQKAKTASEAAGKAADKSAEDIQKQALAHHAAAKAAGLQYDNTGQLVTMNGKAVSSQQAATHGLQTFSAEAYLAGRAAVSAGEDAEAAAQVAADAQAAAADAAAEHASALEEVATTAGLSGAAVVAGVGLAVKAYADFDKQMSVVDSATHETAGNMDLLRQAAIDAGADTAFSAVDAARGIEEMAKAGVTTADILGGGLKGTLALAAAGALDVGDASEIAASAMVQFGLKGKDIPHIADLLAAAAGKAQGSVQDMGLALSYAGVPAAGLGISIEQTTGTLAMFAKAGIVGEKAGTALRAMLVSMVKPADVTQKTMDNLGISFSDASGEFIGLDGAGAVLQERLGGLDEMTRNATLAQIFGNEALGAAQTLYNNGAEGVREMTAAVDEYGYATDTANRMQNNLTGDLEKLGGSFDTVLIQSGSGASEVLRGLVKGLNGLVDVVGSIPAPTLSVGLGLAGVAGGALVLGSGLVALNAKIATTSAALALLAPAGTRAGTALAMAGTAAKLAGVAAGLAVATFAIAKLAESDYMSKIDTGMGRVADSLAEVSTNGPAAGSALDQIFKDRDGGDLINTVTDLDSAIKRTFNRDAGQQFNDWGEAVVNGMTGVKGSSQILGESFGRLDKGLAELVSGGKGDDAAKSFERIKKAAADQDVSVEELTKKFPQYADALKAAEAAAKTAATETDGAKDAIKGAGDAAADAGPSAEDLAKQLEDVGLRADASVENLDKFTQALVNAGLLTLSARDATAKFEEGLDGLKGKIDEIMLTEQAHGGVLNENRTDFDLFSEAGRAANDVLADMTQRGISAAEAMAKNGASMPEVQGQLTKTYDAMVLTARGFGLGKDEAEALTRSILHIPPGVDINTWMSDEAKRMADATKKAIDDIPARKDVQVNITESINRQVKNSAYADDPSMVALDPANHATGGRIPGYADGGQLPTSGPGTGMTDGFLGISSAGVPMARVDAGEWIIKRSSSDRYPRELAAINAGTFPKMPGYASGGREYSAQSFGHAPYRASAQPAAGMHIDKVEINQQRDPGATFAEFARRTNALNP
ncbi:phage tail tape measure protein [Pseudarthrobacter sp. NIBRBAC000502772]|uniref:phage tail tape measure protein n=1 Tax=Pseudarthrobacter sp. NIBRBAC000502772 TaxID=2590775 RepID=UPI00112FFA22|nr:phage tail tape measure protein [Pseudarthrobacter sp. NIBRBAC000502772]QDG65851.1 phage tail tape measure protein [Pseudarthrobacter sp. NIBRBAC000502772]